MATVKFIIQANSNNSRVYLRFRDGRGVDIKLKTDYIISVNQWDLQRGFPKRAGDEIAKFINAELKTLEATIYERYNRTDRSVVIDTNWLKEIVNTGQSVNHVVKKKDSALFSSQVDKYVLAKRKLVKASAIRKYKRTNEIVQEIGKLLQKKIKVKDIDWDFKAQFDDYCNVQAYSPSYIRKVFKNIKTIAEFAFIQDGVEIHPMLRGRVPYSESENKAIFLSFEEIERIENFDFENERLNNVRDWLIISCGTGARISDFMNFSPQMIEKYISNGKVVRDIKYRQVKTNQQILSGIYENTPMYRTLKRLGWTFPPKISSQKYNDYLKEIGKLAGLDDVVEGDKIDPNTKRKVRGRFKKFELLTSHIGRRSFATNYYGKIPTSDLMVLTGHKSEGMLLKYIRKSGEEKNVEAVNKVRKWLHS